MAAQGPVLVVGAQGMLGTDLMEHLAAPAPGATGMDLGELDITDAERVRSVFHTLRPETVFNVAAVTNVDGCESSPESAYAVNANGAGNVAAACAEIGATMIHVSTDYVFDGSSGRAYVETDELSPLGVYGKSKAEGEKSVLNALGDRCCIARTQWLYGPHGKNFVETILSLARTRDVLRVVADQIGSPTHTWDLAAGLVTLWEKGARGFFHLTDSGSVSWHGFAVEILKRAGIQGVTVEAISTDELDRPAPRPLYSVLDNSKYNAFSGRPLPSWEAALAYYFERRAARESS